MNPLYSTIFNFVFALFGVAESTGLTNVLSSQGGKAGAVAATVLAIGNAALHAWSSAQPGPFSSNPAPPKKSQI